MSVSLSWRPMLFVTHRGFRGFQEFCFSLFGARFLAVEGRELRHILVGTSGSIGCSFFDFDGDKWGQGFELGLEPCSDLGVGRRGTPVISGWAIAT